MASIVVLLCARTAASSALEPYTDARFGEMTKGGALVVLDVHADWCPTCLRQQPALKSVVESAPYTDFRVLVVDYDQQGDVRKRFRVASQSTLVVFKGAAEVGRATGITQPDQIRALLDRAR